MKYLNAQAQITSLYNQGQYQEALKLCDQSLETTPQDPQLFFFKALVLKAIDQKEEAIKCLDKAIAFNPKFYASHHNKGLLLTDLKQYQEAIESFDTALILNPSSKIYCDKGDTLVKVGNTQEAIESYNKAIELDPGSFLPYVKNGIALSTAGLTDEALVSYDKSISKYQFYSEAYHHKGLLLAKLGRQEEAIKVFDQLLKIDPQNPMILCDKAKVYRNMDKEDLAKASYKQASDLIELFDSGKNSIHISKEEMPYIKEALQSLASFQNTINHSSQEQADVKATGELADTSTE